MRFERVLLVLGLYDQRGMLRFAGHDPAECLAYAALFELADGSFSLEPLLDTEAAANVARAVAARGVFRHARLSAPPVAGCSN